MTSKQNDTMKRFISRLESDGAEKFITYYPGDTHGLVWVVETTEALYRVCITESSYEVYSMTTK